LSTLAIPSFIEPFKDVSKKEEEISDYTNGIYAVSPFISYLADQPNARSFREKFIRSTGREPLRWAGTYYDAMLVALNAVEKAEVQGENIREDRKRVRDALSSINEKDVAVNGVTGDIYFDEDGNVADPSLTLGVWWNHEFLPAYQQYNLSDLAALNTEQSKNDGGGENEKQDKEGSGESKITPLRVVDTGVDINAIRNIDLKKGIFTADFYLWFRFKGSFEDRAIKFINAVKPVTLEKPIMRKTDRQGVTVHAYRVVADFTIEDDTVDSYPLDFHTLNINFYYQGQTREKMIYIPDVTGLTDSVAKKNRGETMLEKIAGWEVAEIALKQHIRTVAISKKKKNLYSGIDTEISIRRENRGILCAKILLPVFVIMICNYLLFFLSPERIRFRLIGLFSLLVLMAGIRILYGYILPGQDIIQEMMILVFALIIFTALVSGGAYWAHHLDYIKIARCILYKGSFLYLVIAVAGIGFLSYSYALWPSQLTEMPAQKEIITWLIKETKEITATLLK
jgi:branched-chain amino acid transport system substrate-binding protein